MTVFLERQRIAEERTSGDHNMIKLLPSEIDRIMDVIKTNTIVSRITLESDNSSGIGQYITMSWEGDYNGIPTTFTVCITDEGYW